jgi:membrane fusion protein, multidrug efflux system
MRGNRSFGVFYVIGIALIAVAAGVWWYFLKSREVKEAEEAKAKAAQLAAGPNVTVAKSQRGPNIRRLTLVGEALPAKSTTLYSKVGGYLTRINVDVGDRVSAGQVIAEIQSPELDAQIATITTSLENKRQIARRTEDLAKQGFYSQQTLDNANTEVRVAESQINEIKTLGSYRTIRAPFAGVITGRFADPGALVTNAASNQTAALPLVTVADTSRLKVTVYVEQADAPYAKPGLDAEVVDAATVDRKVAAKVTRVSGELDARTRTLRTEVEFDNKAGTFFAGSFVNVSLLIPATSFIEVPAGALINRDKKTWVATIDSENKAHLVPIVMASTDGKVLRIASGLDEGVTVAVSPPAGLADGAKVNPQQPPGAPTPAAKPADAKPADAQPLSVKPAQTK